MEKGYCSIGNFSWLLLKQLGIETMSRRQLICCTNTTMCFPKGKKKQLLWSRCVNTRGYTGTNIPCDLYMEHLNRQLKSIIQGMGGNVTPARIQKAAKSIAVVCRVCEAFEIETVGHRHSDRHPYPTFEKDLAVIVKILEEEKVLVKKPA